LRLLSVAVPVHCVVPTATILPSAWRARAWIWSLLVPPKCPFWRTNVVSSVQSALKRFTAKSSSLELPTSKRA